MTSMSAEVDVAADPASAFTAFTEEYDAWWGNGPIDAYESWRVIERRIEPGVGGRIVEDYGDDERVLGTITIWEPGARLAWTTRNDVTIDVTFAALASGTRVTVAGIVPDGVDGTAQLVHGAMAPQWFPRHLARKAVGRTLPEPVGSGSRCARRRRRRRHAGWPARSSSNAPATFPTPRATLTSRGSSSVSATGCSFCGAAAPRSAPTRRSSTSTTSTLTSSVRSAAGATIVTPIADHGFRGYTAQDCEGRHWQFMQAGPRIGH